MYLEIGMQSWHIYEGFGIKKVIQTALASHTKWLTENDTVTGSFDMIIRNADGTDTIVSFDRIVFFC